MIQTEDKDFSRDTSNRALINTNVRALQEHIAKREQAKRLDKLESDVSSIMSVLLEIQQTLRIRNG
jgi:hypothetical protein